MHIMLLNVLLYTINAVLTYAYHAFKSSIVHYKSRNTTVIVTLLYASTTFDHWLLFKRLIAKYVPLFIIRLRLYWYYHLKNQLDR